jgi:hypothetical protein
MIFKMEKKNIEEGLDNDNNKMKEFERLQRQNDKMRENLSKIIGTKKTTWILINELINNEIEQEELCE